jgi:hypothetical protein
LCGSLPAVSGIKPNATNTAVLGGLALVPSGGLKITSPGTVVEGRDIRGSVTIAANNVTIRDSRIHSSADGDYIAVRVADGVTGTRVLNSELYTDDNGGGMNGVDAVQVQACGNHIHGFENGLTVGGGSIVQSNFIEKLHTPNSGPHPDGIEVYQGSDIQVLGNNILMTDADGSWLEATGAINVTSEYSNVSNVTISGNWMGGGSFTLYVRESSASNGFGYSGVAITNNRWSGPPSRGYAHYGAMSSDGGISQFSGNVWDATGEPVQIG